MSSHVTVDRWQFTLTVTFHYLFPIVTMGLAVFIAWLQTVAHLGREDRRWPLRRTAEDRRAHEAAAHLWTKVFAVSFAVGVVTGVPMEFQFGTNWAAFSNYAGGVIGQTLAMEGVFAFFAESLFIGILLAGRGRVSERLRWIAALMMLAGSWVSGFFIIATNAWMQHPVGYTLHDGRAQLDSLGQLLTNPWLPWQYSHTMSGAAVSGAFLLAALGAFYTLSGRHPEVAGVCLRIGVVGALVFSLLQIFPTGDRHARQVARYQPSSFAAMEGLFRSERGAPLVIIGTPDTERRRLESAIEMPHALSLLTSRRWDAEIRGLDSIPVDRWPDSVPLVYYAYHIMVGVGTLLLVLAALAVLLVRRGRLLRSRSVLWALMLAPPFTFVANIAGWTVAETGRQPWVVFGLMRTHEGASPASSVPAGTAIFTLLGFAGLYLVIGLVYVLIVVRIVARGPDLRAPPTKPRPTAAAVVG
jgi:cytochrome d ubiquinol oxidase subunit I